MPDSDSTSSRKASTESIEPDAQPQKEDPNSREPEERRKRSPSLRRSIFLLLCALLLAAGGFLAGRFGCSAGSRKVGSDGGGAAQSGTAALLKGKAGVFEVLISGHDILVGGKPVGADEAAERAASSGSPVRVVYAPDARTSAEDALMRAFRKRGVSVSEVLRKE